MEKNPKPVKGKNWGGLGWVTKCKDGAPPLRTHDLGGQPWH